VSTPQEGLLLDSFFLSPCTEPPPGGSSFTAPFLFRSSEAGAPLPPLSHFYIQADHFFFLVGESQIFRSLPGTVRNQ